MMKLFKVTSKNVAFDEDESMIIIAESSKNAKNLASKNWIYRDGKNREGTTLLTEEIILDKEQIVNVSHYGD